MCPGDAIEQFGVTIATAKLGNTARIGPRFVGLNSSACAARCVAAGLRCVAFQTRGTGDVCELLSLQSASGVEPVQATTWDWTIFDRTTPCSLESAPVAQQCFESCVASACITEALCTPEGDGIRGIWDHQLQCCQVTCMPPPCLLSSASDSSEDRAASKCLPGTPQFGPGLPSAKMAVEERLGSRMFGVSTSTCAERCTAYGRGCVAFQIRGTASLCELLAKQSGAIFTPAIDLTNLATASWTPATWDWTVYDRTAPCDIIGSSTPTTSTPVSDLSLAVHVQTTQAGASWAGAGASTTTALSDGIGCCFDHGVIAFGAGSIPCCYNNYRASIAADCQIVTPNAGQLARGFSQDTCAVAQAWYVSLS